MQLNPLVEEQTRRALKVTPDEFEALRSPNPSQLHDPFMYKDMREIIGFLHRFKQEQLADPNLILAVMPDYDTDGISSAVIISAALSAFEINHRMYVPSMSEGYGLSAQIVDNMKEMFETDDLKIKMILTADNGIRAFEGVDRAKEHGIQVLITDHHLGADTLPSALAVVNPNRHDDLYPFKGNSGATVVWKVMLAYARTYDKEKVELIERLIVFAGLSNVADVMPILDENRYMVKRAVEIINAFRKVAYSVHDVDYSRLSDTPYPGYNVVFHGLFDLVALLQESKDEERAAQDKGPIPLPTNEELFGWYLSPLLNAPRRVHDTSLEGMLAFLSTNVEVRHQGILALIALNEERKILRDKVIDALDNSFTIETGTVICANTRGGISGLVAGKLGNDTGLPAVVFSFNDESDETVIYATPPTKASRISASARSNQMYPLDLIMEKMNEKHPNLVSGGGHTAAAGFSIKASDYKTFVEVFHDVIPDVYAEVSEAISEQVVEKNNIIIDFTEPNKIIAKTNVLEDGELVFPEHILNNQRFAAGALESAKFSDSLRPFGHEFEGQTTYTIVFDDLIHNLGWNPKFWKTFKFQVADVEFLTFDIAWATLVKVKLERGETIKATGELKLNEFRGKVTPQFVLSPL